MKPILLQTSAEMSRWSTTQLEQGHRIALVPTMGALHAGHLRLVEEASARADLVVVSIFVNPTQFGPGEDLDAYPRTLDEDLAALEGLNCVSVVFAPPASEMYPNYPNLTWVEVDTMGDYLCGASRPGHFKGVTTVVSRLFAICRPQLAVFGLKDAQQFFILKRMTQDFGFGTELIGIPTVREEDGMALSSRNRYLSSKEREEAVALSRAVEKGRKLLLEGTFNVAADLVSVLKTDLSQLKTGVIDYVDIVDTSNLQPISSVVPGQQLLIALAVKFGRARLIDNSIVEIP